MKGIEGPNNNSLKSCSNNHKLLEKKEKRLKKAKEYRLQNESLEERELRLRKRHEYMKARRKNESSVQRVKRLAKNTCYKKSGKRTKDPNNNSLKSGSNSHNTIDMKQLIKDFHNLVSNGPLYRCTCCDQLWYKHSVLPADRIGLANLNIVKYLQNIKSFDNVDWLCNTCSNHLRKGRVPPCAIANGMKFPEKPDFFDFNELECRLIAPWLAFQKIFQAPRGGQLKITGNVVLMYQQMSAVL